MLAAVANTLMRSRRCMSSSRTRAKLDQREVPGEAPVARPAKPIPRRLASNPFTTLQRACARRIRAVQFSQEGAAASIAIALVSASLMSSIADIEVRDDRYTPEDDFTFRRRKPLMRMARSARDGGGGSPQGDMSGS